MSEDFSNQFNRVKLLEGKKRAEFLASLPADVGKEIERLLSDESPTFGGDSGTPSRQPTRVPRAPQEPAPADHNLLFGILAWQAGVVSEAQLLGAMQAWTFRKGKSLGEILAEQSVLSDSQRDELDQMVRAHLRLHGDNAGQALESLSSLPAVANSLRQQISDGDVLASLNHFQRSVASEYPSGKSATVLSPSSSGESRFQVLRPHARGGLGEVFVARDAELNREVALKEIQKQFADQADSRGRFVLEAEVTGSLEHPGIVPVYGLGQYDDGRPYYAMRFIKGDSLKEAIKEFHDNQSLSESERTLQLRKLLGRFVDVCQAISYAHSRGVLHRDLKPGNIMLGKYGETLVVDWGLAKVAGRDDSTQANDEQTLQPGSGSGVTPTMMGSAIGTPAYMPPEQAAGRLDQLGPASDVYSLGVTLYHLLTGEAPFTGKDLRSTLKGVQHGTFKAPRALSSDIPQPLEAVCLKAMSLKPADRYGSPQDLANDVEQFLADEPVSAMSEPLLVRAGRWVREHQTLTATTAAVVLVGIASLGLFQKYRSDRAATDLIVQTKNAEEQKRLAGEAKEATQKSIRTLYEMHTAYGLTAADQNRPAEALLWFAEAAKLAKPGSHQERASRIRHMSWSHITPSLIHSFDHDEQPLQKMEYDASGQFLATLTAAGESTVWYADSTAGPIRIPGKVVDQAWHPGRSELAIALDDQRVRIFSIPARTSQDIRFSEPISALAFDRQGRKLAICGRTLKLWDFESAEFDDVSFSHPDAVSYLQFSDDGSKILTDGNDNLVRLFLCSWFDVCISGLKSPDALHD